MPTTSRLIHQKEVSAHQKVSVWQEQSHQAGTLAIFYRKAWQCDIPDEADAWLSWARHEYFILSLLAGRGTHHAVAVSDLHVDKHNIELVTHDAGLELQRDWLVRHPTSLANEHALMQLMRFCLEALCEIHRIGIVHGDLKADNVCIASKDKQNQVPDFSSLRLIDFAFSLAREHSLRFVLPIDADRVDYLPPFYRDAISQAQKSKQPESIQKVCCAEIDLFSLAVMMEKTAANIIPDWQTKFEHLPALVNRCKEIGTKRPHFIHRWWPRPFAKPTLAMLNETKKALSLLPDLTQPAAPTPERAPLTTPLTTPLTPLVTDATQQAATPLVTPLAMPVKAIPEHTPAVLDAQPRSGVVSVIPQTTPSTRALFFENWHWPFATMVLGYLFFRIDWVYQREGFLIDDIGYRLGLISFVCGPLMIVGALVSLRKTSHALNTGLAVLALGLTGICAYFLSTLHAQGISWLECLFL